ncbi:MAG TPA: BadF/BadG/BcrA/BcrD ATPase family protein [Hansschlegelia sp.]
MNGGVLHVGVDGGGTRCRARIRDGAGRLLGEGEAGSANARRGSAAAMNAVVSASRAALAAAGRPEETLSSLIAGVGLAGVSQKREMAAMRAEPHPFRSISIATDFAIACLGAHGGGDGGIVIVGTGSAAYGRANGSEWRFGGWGFEVGDDGGGAPLGREAVRSALRAADGLIPRGPLAEDVLHAIGGDQDAAVEWVGRAAPADFGRLAPLALKHAAEDPEARRLVDEAAGHVAALIHRLVACGVGRVALVGGLSAAIEPYLTDAARAPLVAAVADPMDGAIALAKQGQNL